MAPYFPLYIRRSDGKVELKAHSSKSTPNQPTAEQLNQKPDGQGICDFYREVSPGEAKEVDWRRKLGGMLMREIGGKEHKGTPREPNDLKQVLTFVDRNYILAVLPENYRVFEHVKCKISDTDGKPQKTTKNHAAGANERQDAYLYGHPSGPKKRYRSPAEFFPHLLWLATDESGDPDNCSCKFCSPEELETEDKNSKPGAKDPKPEAVKLEDDSKSGVTKSTTQVNVPQQRISQHNVHARSAEPTRLPTLRSREQEIDLQYGRALYRQGEAVWFSRGQAWGLGVVVQREFSQNYERQAQYLIQPLSHPLHHPKQIVCQQDHLRPWLAWSPPPCTHSELNPSQSNLNPVYTFDTVDWQRVLNGEFGSGDAEVDGSILAVKAIETTLTPLGRFDPKSSKTELNSETHYNGIYLGSERIWLGEPVRLRASAAATDVLVLHDIIERPNLRDPSRPSITVVGDTYSYRFSQLEPEHTINDDKHLPMRLREDLHFRNNIASRNLDPGKRYPSSWRLLIAGASYDISNVKGRWYESSLLLPVLDPDGFAEACARGEIGDAGLWINGQGDCNKLLLSATGRIDPAKTFKPADVKFKDRIEAFGRSVPQGLRISNGLDETKPPESGATDTVKNQNQDIKMVNDNASPDDRHLQLQHLKQPNYGQAYVVVPPITDFDAYMKFDDADTNALEQNSDGMTRFGHQYDESQPQSQPQENQNMQMQMHGNNGIGPGFGQQYGSHESQGGFFGSGT